ncbi:hypothetical protein [Alkaliphilus hydrothermalis]|uniref:Gas vesicle protein n=1 Tax=Alkaliphilus hydrothermalis TaxID=1482730 RepID=A0ABS2NM37_9FIRM|nr:hypothetical protein [Alkaliphilus hydrothermalis]MBM7613941.1 gas vesicle protein [Alkaliphilus hydrothermalis]
MNKTMMGLITGSLLGATVGIYAVSNMSPRERKKTLRRTKKMLKASIQMMGMGNILG